MRRLRFRLWGLIVSLLCFSFMGLTVSQGQPFFQTYTPDISSYAHNEAGEQPSFLINLPLNITYTSNKGPVNISAFDGSKFIVNITCQLDDQPDVLLFSCPPVNDYVGQHESLGRVHWGMGMATISNLADGEHHLKATVTKWMGGYNVLSSDVYFTVDRTPPKISILSGENKTYSTVIPLNFTIDTPTFWMGYSLDNQSNSTIFGNFTLTDLTDGPHSIIIYANDTTGNMGKSETLFFAINNPTPTPTNPDYSVNLSYNSAIAIVIAIVAVAIVSLVYFRRKGKP